MKKITLLIAFMLSLVTMGYGQTVLIDPAAGGGFTSGSTFAANGWTVSNSANNPWIIGTAAATGTMTGNAAYISNTGTALSYDTANYAGNYFYRDVTVPAGETKISLTFNWYGQGESTWDLWQVFTAPTTVTPAGTTTYPGSGASNVPAEITGATFVGNGNLQGTVQTATYTLPASMAGTTFRLIFYWKSDNGGGAQPPAAIDNISLTSAPPSNYVSIATGNFGDASIWNLNSVPTALDHITVAAGHTVTINATGQAATNVVVNGTLAYGTTPTTFAVGGNLTVNATGAINVFNVTTGKTLTVAGNIVNDGSINVSVGTTSAGNLTLNGSAVQTLSGTGTFVNNMIRNLIFSNTSTAIPNINWQMNNINVEYNLNISNAKINLGANTFTYGSSIALPGNTFTVTNGGFMAGGKFVRWWDAASTGYTTSGPTSVATGAAGRYPFYTPDGQQRIFYLGRTTPTAGGKFAVVYNNATTFTTGLSIVDGAYTITDRWNGNFVVTTEATSPAAASYWTTIFAPDLYYPTSGNSRVMGQSAAIGGTHVNTSTFAAAQRSGVSLADVTAATGLYMGIAQADLSFTSIANGNWNNPAIWNKGVVPTCNDAIIIGLGTTVTVNSAANVVKNITINAGGTLIVASGDLTVGCTLNNNYIRNNGTLTVSGGILNINGSLNVLATAAIFNQSGGTIKIDGNAAGVVADSVAASTALFSTVSTNVNLTGGTLLFVDPHVGTTNSTAYTISFSNGTGSTATSPSLLTSAAHITQFGDGISTNAGGHTSGFYINNWATTAYMSLGSIVVNGGSGTNRMVVSQYQLTANGSVTINAGSSLTVGSLIVGGNLTVNATGSLVNTVGVVSGVTTSSSTTALTFGPTSAAQTFTNNGTIGELAVAPTTNFLNLTINNTNAAGVTMASPFAVSTALTLTAGKVNTTTANLLSVGTATAAGTITGGSATAYVSGPLARTIASGNANTNYITFPVGKTAYAPVFLAPTTTAVTVMKAEAFDTNTGTADPGIINLAANRRWEAPVVSGTVTDVKVRLGDANITAVKIPVMAPTATGIYNSSFGSTATYAAGTPNTVQGLNAVTLANYTGFLSFAESNVCAGTPAPGNTIASANNICLGASVTFSVQNNTTGTGVTYQWQSSVNGSAFTDISGATSVTYTTVPSAALYYRLNVTCATGPATGASTPVQITFSNPAPTSTTPGTRCGQGTVTLSAAGAGILNWYTAATGGAAVATGGSFTTPSLTATTNYYVSTGTAVPSTLVTLGTSIGTIGDAGTSPYYHGWGGVKTQYIIKASELSDAGIIAGPINSIAFTIGTVGTAVLNDFTVSMGTTTQNVATTTHVDGLSPVYTNAAQTLTAGVNTYTFSTPFNWNGTSNIVLQVCYSNVNTGGTSSSVQYYTPGFVCSTYTYADNKTVAQICPTLTGTVDGSGGTASSSNRPKLIINGTSLCAGPRTLVAATVNTAPTFTLSGNPAPICAGQTTAAVTITAGAADYNTFVWTPSTGVSGNATSGWTFNPAVSTSYSLQASQSTGSLCNAVPVTVNVTVNALPGTMSIAAAPINACAESITPLTVTGGNITGTAVMGTATTLTTDIEHPTAFCNRWGNYWSQTIYTAAELTAAGLTAGNITSLAFNIATLGDGDSNANYTIKIGTTTATNFANTTFLATTSYTTVYGPQTYIHTASGQQVINFTTPFPWDGTSNLVVNITHSGADITNNSQTYYTATTDDTVLWKTSFDASTTTGTLSKKRLNVTLQSSQVLPVTWSPVTNLYTNAAATTAYTAGTNAKTVYFKSSVATPAVTYTATATTPNTCTRTATVDVSVTSTPAPTVPASTQDICNAGTVANLVATGTAIKWYADATGGTALAPTVALVNGENYFASQTANGCESLTRVEVVVAINAPAAPAISNDAQVFCNNATVADLLPNGPEIKWYTGTAGGSALASTEALVSGTPYYASQTVNGCEGLLRGMVTATVLVTPAPVVDDVDQVFCNAATVADLLPNDASIKWYAGSTGGMPLASTEALVSGTPYYASQTVDGCEGLVRTEVAVTINVTPAPTGDDEQEFCTSAIIDDLVAEGNAIVWYDAEIGGTAYVGSTALEDGVVYYASQAIDGCEGLVRFGVTAVIHTVVADAPEDVNVCTEYVLPALTNGAYFTEAGGTGIELAAGSVINETTTLYVYAQEGTDVVCSDENSFIVTVANIAAPTGDDTQTIEGSVGPDVTVADLQTDPVAGTVTWYASEEDALAGINALADDAQLAQGATYYATQTVGECTSVEVFAVTVDIVLDRENFDVKAFTFHPNPVKDILNLSYSSDITSVTVFNLLGQKVISQESHATDVKVDMSSLADGAYVVNVTSGNAVKTIKVIKKQ